MPLLPENWHGPLLTADCDEVGTRVLHDGERLQSLLCLLPTSLTTALGEYIRTGGKSVKAWHALHNAAEIRVSESQNAFANINTKAELNDL
jgi:molybdopterin-guanine dinucleotide biosynthesis protein A